MTPATLAALVSRDMPMGLDDGQPIVHRYSWTALVDQKTPNAGKAVALLLAAKDASPPGYGYGTHIVKLVDVKDDQEKTALQLATKGPREAIHAHLLFCGRYELHFGPPEHRSATSVVVRALDRNFDYQKLFLEADADRSGHLDRRELEELAGRLGLTVDLLLGRDASRVESISESDFTLQCKKQLGDGPRQVVLKLMSDPVQWKREKEAREGRELDARFVVQALDSPEAEEVKRARDSSQLLKQWEATHLPNFKLGAYMIVMDAADRNLLQIYQQERPDLNASRTLLQQLFEVVCHLHEQELMHGDLKMPNIVRIRIDNRLRAIDFDAAQPFSKHESGLDAPQTYAAAKFSSAVLPPELVYKLTGADERRDFDAYFSSSDKELQDKVAPRRAGTRQYVVKTFRTDGAGNAITEGLPYTLVEASATVDCWALGTIAYLLCVGEPLFPSTRDDDLASGQAMADLYEWGTKERIVSARLQKVPDTAARDLIASLLQRDPSKRLSMSNALQHPFFHPDGKGGEVDQVLAKQIEEMNERTKRMEAEQQKHTSMLTTIQELGFEHRNELRRSQQVHLIYSSNLSCLCSSSLELPRLTQVLLKAIFEATEVQTPTSFIILKEKLPSLKERRKQPMLALEVKEDGSGFKVGGQLVGQAQAVMEQLEEGQKWMERICSFGDALANADVNMAFKTIQKTLGDLVTGDTMYLYLIDELTGKPVCGEAAEAEDVEEEDEKGEDDKEEGEKQEEDAAKQGYPIEITKPAEIVAQLLPVMQVGMRAMSVYNGVTGVFGMLGLNAKVPDGVMSKAQRTVELLKQESSVEQFGAINEVVMSDEESPEKKTVRGASLRELQRLLKEHDKEGDFSGLRRVADNDGVAVWTRLSDANIKLAIEKRTKQRRAEEGKIVNEGPAKSLVAMEQGKVAPEGGKTATDAVIPQREAKMATQRAPPASIPPPRAAPPPILHASAAGAAGATVVLTIPRLPGNDS